MLIRDKGVESCVLMTCRRESQEWWALYVAVRLRRVRCDDEVLVEIEKKTLLLLLLCNTKKQ